MYYLIFILLILIGLLIKTNKIYKYISFIFMVLLIFCDTKSADYLSYNTVYNYIGITNKIYHDVGIGYSFLCLISNRLGLSYNGFLGLAGIISLSLIFITVKRYSSNFGFVLALYMIFPFLLDCVQTRNFLAVSILIYSMQYLISDKKRSVFKYIIAVTIATFIHSSMYFYFIFILIPLTRNLKKNYIKGITVIITISGVLFRMFIPLIAVKFVTVNRIARYFNDSISVLAALLYMMIFVIWYVFIRYANKLINECNSQKEKNPVNIIEIRFSELILKCNILVFCSFPLVLFSADFLRIERNLWILNYIVAAIAIRKIHERKPALLYKLVMIVYTAAANIAFISYFTFGTVVKPLLNNLNIPNIWR